MGIYIQGSQTRESQTKQHDIDLTNAQLKDQQTAYDRGYDFQQTMLVIAIELQRANPPPIDPLGIRQPKQDAKWDYSWYSGLGNSF